MTDAAAGRGTAFAPFTAMEDRTPALYLGFRRPAAGRPIGVLLDIEEVPGDEAGPPLEWEHWDGAGWQRIAVEDETAHLALPGIAYVLWPGVAAPPASVVVERCGQRRAPARCPRRDALRRRRPRCGCTPTAAVSSPPWRRVSGETITLAAPLDRDVGQGTLARAGLARFGTPRTLAARPPAR